MTEHTSEELTTEELKDLQMQQHTDVLQQTGDAEEVEEVISTLEIKRMWEKLLDFIKKKQFNDTCLTYFRTFLK